MRVREATSADAAAIARVQVDTWRTAYRGLMPADYLAGLSYEAAERQWARALTPSPENRQVLCVAEDEAGTVIGFAAAGPERSGGGEYSGEVYALYVLAAHQRRGLGRRLARCAAARLAAAGMGSLLIWVLKENPSRRFYEAMGGQLVREQRIEFRGLTRDEVAYGWADASAAFLAEEA